MASVSRSSSLLPICARSIRRDTLRSSPIASSSRHASSFAPSKSDGHVPDRTSQSDPDDLYDVKNIEKFEFDDSPTIGHMLLEQARSKMALLRRMEDDQAVLKSQRKTFVPPTPSQFIRLKSVINLDTPHDPQSSKRTATIPVASLPLTSPEAIHRFKLLAGVRWTPPQGAGTDGLRQDISTDSGDRDQGDQYSAINVRRRQDDKEGWITISSEQFPAAEMNKKWLMDTLGKLVREANSSASPLATLETPLPLDTRHILARQRKQKGRNGHAQRYERAEARRSAGFGGGVKGFPAEWL